MRNADQMRTSKTQQGSLGPLELRITCLFLYMILEIPYLHLMAWHRPSKPTIFLGRPIPSWPLALQLFMSTPKTLSLLTFVVLYSATAVYCRTHYFRDPTSHFFDPIRGYSKIYSNIRQAQADTFILFSNTSYSSSYILSNASRSPTLCIGVTTVARPKEQYIRGTIGSLLQGLSDDQRREIHLILFIANTEPHTHPIYGERWIENLPDTVLGYEEVQEDQLVKLKHWETAKDYAAKSLFDYVYLLDYCYRTKSPYIAMIEDDVLAVDGWFLRVAAAVNKVTSNGDDWLYIRMFYTEIFLGWNQEEWPTYLGWCFLAFLLLTGILITIRTFSPRLRKDLSNPTIAVIALICLPLCIMLYFLAGRVSMQPPKTGVHRMDNFGCCSQGLLYPREVIPVVRSHLEHGGTMFVDTVVEDAARQENLARWAIVPSLLQHVGAHSSKATIDADDKAKAIWNFAFETIYSS